MVNDVVFLVQSKVHGVQDSGRVDVVIIVVIGVDKGVPSVVDGRQQDVGLYQWVKDVHQCKEGRDVLGTDG